MSRAIIIPTLLLAIPLAAHAESDQQKLNRLAHDAAIYFGIHPGSFSARFGRMPGGDVAGLALRNQVIMGRAYINDSQFPALVCHEVRHVWQYQAGFRFDFSLPYYQQPHERDAYAKMHACAAAIAGNSPLEHNPARQESPAPQQSPCSNPVTGGDWQQPEAPQQPAQQTPISTDSDITVLVLAVAVIGLVAWWVSREGDNAEANPAVRAVGNAISSGKAFWWFAIAANAIGLAYVLFMFSTYIEALGWGAIGSVGLVLMAVYFLHAVWTMRPNEGLKIIIHSAGMYLLAITI